MGIVSFNPRPRTAGDDQARKGRHWQQKFQSTPAHGGRLCRVKGIRNTKRFNPRPRTAGDADDIDNGLLGQGFNPRPRTAGDSHWNTTKRKRWGFNPRPRTAGDHRAHCIAFLFYCFNPRPRTAGDPAYWERFRQLSVFQSTPAHGGRRGVEIHLTPGRGVSIHARARRATSVRLREPARSLRFNPRPRTAGDSPGERGSRPPRRFNPRPRTAGDKPRQQA